MFRGLRILSEFFLAKWARIHKNTLNSNLQILIWIPWQLVCIYIYSKVDNYISCIIALEKKHISSFKKQNTFIHVGSPAKMSAVLLRFARKTDKFLIDFFALENRRHLKTAPLWLDPFPMTSGSLPGRKLVKFTDLKWMNRWFFSIVNVGKYTYNRASPMDPMAIYGFDLRWKFLSFKFHQHWISSPFLSFLTTMVARKVTLPRHGGRLPGRRVLQTWVALAQAPSIARWAVIKTLGWHCIMLIGLLASLYWLIIIRINWVAFHRLTLAPTELCESEPRTAGTDKKGLREWWIFTGKKVGKCR